MSDVTAFDSSFHRLNFPSININYKIISLNIHPDARVVILEPLRLWELEIRKCAKTAASVLAGVGKKVTSAVDYYAE